MKKLALCAAALLCLLSLAQVSFAGPALDTAIADYKKGHYSAALAKCLAIEKAEGKNANARYYAGACYQALGKYDAAKKEYRWVYKNAPKPLSEYARVALTRLGEGLEAARKSEPSPTYLFSSDVHPVGFEKGIGSTVPGAAPQAPSR
jgi:tetratricopeptide (TPR) repeat protein